MATKTFEELKQLATAIRDMNLKHGNTAQRVGTFLIDEINKIEEELNFGGELSEEITKDLATFKKEVLTKTEELGDSITLEKKERITAMTEANVSVLCPTSGYKADGSLGGDLYDFELARSTYENWLLAQVGSSQISVGSVIGFYDKNNNGAPVFYEYLGGTVTNVNHWVKRDFIQINSITQDHSSGVKEAHIAGWNSVVVTKNVEKLLLGEIKKVTQVDVIPHTGDTLLFQVDHMLGKEGYVVNINVTMYSPISFIADFKIYTGGTGGGSFEFISPARYYIKEGVNNIWVSFKVLTAVGVNPWQVYFRERTTLIDKTLYCTAYYYYGQRRLITFDIEKMVSDSSVASKNYADNKFVTKIEGKGLSNENYTIEEKSKLSAVDLEEVFNNIAYPRIMETVSGFTDSHEEDGVLHLKVENKPTSGYVWLNFGLSQDVFFTAGHKYYVAIDLLIKRDSRTEGSTSSGGNFYGSISPKYNDAQKVGTGSVKSGVVHGTRGFVKAELVADELAAIYNASRIFFQFSNYSSTDYLEAELYGISCVDLGLDYEYMTWNQADELISKYGTIKGLAIIQEAIKAKEADRAKVAESVEKFKVGGDIELWGDSLTAQNYSQYLSELTGRNVTTRGYGGKKSTYIRDIFLANADISKTQVFWIGRNNYGETDIIIDDLRAMVEHLGHDNFIIMPPPNGNYGTFGSGVTGEDGSGEMRNGSAYRAIINLTERLAKEFPSNFLDIRAACNYGWNMGGIKLLTPFVQPSIGENVQISVSDATFLTTYNVNDASKFGDDFMQKIRIGINGLYDIYKIISKDTENLLTVQLEEVKYKSVGSTVDNLIDDGGTNSIKYLKVMQNADYMCWLYDTGLSTFRSDGIHMTQGGLREVARHVARKLNGMKI